MHNNIMAAGSRDRPPMLATGRYAQWRSQFLRYIDTRTKFVPVTENSPAVPKQTTVETVMNMTPENRAHFESEKEAIHLILTGIEDEIYSTVDACKIAQEMWEAIERLQQVATMQVNVQFLQQLQPKWSRFVTNVKQQHKLDVVSYHKLFDILKQYQKEVNELRAERMAKNARPIIAHKSKTVFKDSTTYHKDKMLLCKQAEKGVQLQAEQSDWLADTDEEIDEQELEAHYSYMAKIQEVPNADSGTDI
ncbi:hypothetical protein Tco_1578132 [Tanacetum coccineum]